MEAYWDLSLRMVALVTEIEAFAGQGARKPVAVDDAEYVSLRKGLDRIENDVLDISRG